MRIVKPNGEVIECSVEEYNSMQKQQQEVSQPSEPDDNIVVDTSNDPINIVKKYESDRKQYMREYMQKWRKNSKPIVGTIHDRASSGKRWKRSEDKIISTNKIDDSVKLLPKRTRVAIYARRTALKQMGTKFRKKAGKNDGRVKMLRIVNKIVEDMHKSNPKLDLKHVRRTAFEIYRNKFMK